MILDWCPGIREACAHWRAAPMLQQTFEALNDLRNKAGPASHGKDPYLDRLAEHQRRSAVLAVGAEDSDTPTLRFLLPGGDDLPINIEVSRLLHQLDREAYVKALNTARGARALAVEPVEEQGVP